MYCPNCGKPADDSAAFCPNCGNDLGAARAAAGKAAQPEAQTAPMPAAADPAAQARYDAEMAQYQRDLAAYEAEHGPAAGGGGGAGAAGGGAPPVAAAPAKKSRAGCIVAGCLVALFLCALMSCSVWLLFGAALKTIPMFGGDSGPSISATTEGAATPDSAVDAWYAAVAEGDLAAAKAASMSAFAKTLTSDQFDGQTQTFEHTVVSTEVSGDTATVVVHQTSPGVSGVVTLTFTIEKSPMGTWLISDVVVTDATVSGDSGTKTDPAPSAQTPAPSTPAPKPATPTVIDQKTAIDTVGRFLEAAKTDDLTEQRRLTTDRFKAANPTWISAGTSQALIQFEVVKAVRKGDVWLVYTKESWISGPETPTWTVVTQKGEGRVDRMSGLN
jgi:hypothetical protein